MPPSSANAITSALNTNPHLTSLPLPKPQTTPPSPHQKNKKSNLVYSTQTTNKNKKKEKNKRLILRQRHQKRHEKINRRKTDCAPRLFFQKHIDGKADTISGGLV